MGLTDPGGELGPTMRVGLYASDEPFIVTADSPFARSGSGELLVSLPARSPVTVRFNKANRQYQVTSLGLDRVLSDHIVVQAWTISPSWRSSVSSLAMESRRE